MEEEECQLEKEDLVNHAEVVVKPLFHLQNIVYYVINVVITPRRIKLK